MINEAINFSAALGAARNQGNRPTCLAFASSDLNRFANDVGAPLSVEYLCHTLAKGCPGWKPDQGFSMGSAIAALQSPGQPEETLYPYLSATVATPLAATPSGLSPLYTCKTTKRNLTSDDVISSVRAGAAVAVIVRITQTFYKPIAGVIDFSPSFIPNALHALVAVGVGEHKDTKQTHIFIRNSWGAGWGVNGHAWLPKQYLDAHLRGSFAL